MLRKSSHHTTWLTPLLVTAIAIAATAIAKEAASPATDAQTPITTGALYPKTDQLVAALAEHDPTTHAQLIAAESKLWKARVAEVTAFARKHHPELASLLDSLETSRPETHRAAVLALSKDLHRIESARKRDNAKSAIERWEVDSRIRLITARLTGGQQVTPALETQLHALLRRQTELERDALRANLERFDVATQRSRERLNESLETDLQHKLEKLLRKASKTNASNAS